MKHDLAAHGRMQTVDSRQVRALLEFVGVVERMVDDVDHCHVLPAEGLVAGWRCNWTWLIICNYSSQLLLPGVYIDVARILWLGNQADFSESFGRSSHRISSALRMLLGLGRANCRACDKESCPEILPSPDEE